MDLCANLAKCVLSVINLILWAVAVALIFVAGWIFSEYLKYSDHLESLTDESLFPVFILLAVGFLLFIFVAVGFVAIFKENKCLLSLYFLLLVVILIALVSAFVASFVLRNKIKINLYTHLDNGLKQYKSNRHKAKIIDFIQKQFLCCGVHNYTDWVNTDWYNRSYPDVRYPASCCTHDSCSYNDPDPSLHKQGCYGELKQVILSHFLAILACGAGCSLILIIGMTCTCLLLFGIHRRRLDVSYSIISEADGPEQT